MGADIEFVTAVIRAGRDYQGREHAKAGGPGYEFAATAIIRGGTAEIVGAAGRLTPRLVRDIEVALTAAGINHANWDRVRRTGLQRVERKAAHAGRDTGVQE